MSTNWAVEHLQSVQPQAGGGVGKLERKPVLTDASTGANALRTPGMMIG